MALSAKEKLIAALKAGGFALDPTATKYRSRYSDDRVQNPNVYVKDATFGGTWRIRLEWNQTDSYYNRDTDTLKAVSIEHRPADADPGSEFNKGFKRLYRLENFDRSRYTYSDKSMWVVLDDETKAKPLSVSARAIKMVKDIETAVWLAMEETHSENVRKAEREDKQRQDRAERAKWEQSTMDRREFQRTAYNLHSFALERADGKTDLAAELAKVREALEKLEASLVVEREAVTA
jgi:hypothetical protein